jgi:ribosome hibernation promoting factor
MQVLVTFRHMEATDALRQYAEAKVERVYKYLRRPIEAHVVLAVNKRRHMAEITLSGKHLTVNATEETGDLYSAIDLAMDKLERQIQKRVTKRQSRKHLAAPAVVAAGVKPKAKPVRAGRANVVTERVVVESFTVAEALRRLRRQGDEFLLFQNEANDTLSVLYRRKDGGFGLLEPEIA